MLLPAVDCQEANIAGARAAGLAQQRDDAGSTSKV
jgi:hypothetical protein